MPFPLHFLLPNIKGIPVLMYHKVWPEINDKLTISPEQLKIHLQYIKDSGYSALGLQEFLDIQNGLKPIPEKGFLLTFDDGYLNQLEWAYPLIKQFGFKATFFIIGDTLPNPKLDIAIPPIDVKMGAQELLLMDQETIQLALHSYAHIHYKQKSFEEITADLEKNIAALDTNKIPYLKVLAYPYGGRPKSKTEKTKLWQWMKNNDISLAFRIGNKPAVIPSSQPYEIKRIDIWGTDTVKTLGIKLKKGKLKPF